jgi:hypothetical protein
VSERPPRPVEGVVGPMRVRAAGVEGNQLMFEYHCMVCGGFELEIRDSPGRTGDMRHCYCGACGEWVARLAALKAHLARFAQEAGYAIPWEQFDGWKLNNTN